MSRDLTTLDFEGRPVRTVMAADEPWFVAGDVCAILGLTNPRMAVAGLDADEKGVSTADTPGGPQRVTVVSEPGLYCLIMRSRRPEAKAFSRWVRHDVIPMIRRTGRYEATPPAHPAVPRTYAEALRLAADQAEQIDRQQGHIRRLEPRAAVTDALIDTAGDYSLREAAQILARDHGIDTGQNRLMRSLRELAWIDRYGIPYQRVIDAGWLATRVQTYAHPRTGEPTLGKPQIRVTSRGLTRLHAHLSTDAAAAMEVTR